MLSHCFLEEFHCGLLITRLRDEAFQDFAFMIDGSPKVMLLTVDLDEHLVQMPPPSAGLHALNPSLSDLGSEHRAEPVPPVSHRFMADIDAAFVQQILDISKGQRETDVQLYRQADYLTARFEIAKWIRFGHA